MYQHILVPLDGSELAEQALEHAIPLAQKFDGQLTLLRILSDVAVFKQGARISYDTDLVVELLKNEQQEAVAYLKLLKEKLQARGIKNVESYMVESGAIAESILQAREDLGADTIVMSTHGRSGVTRWLYGSVAEKVLRHAVVPVLLIRAGVEEPDSE